MQVLFWMAFFRVCRKVHPENGIIQQVLSFCIASDYRYRPKFFLKCYILWVYICRPISLMSSISKNHCAKWIFHISIMLCEPNKETFPSFMLWNNEMVSLKFSFNRVIIAFFRFSTCSVAYIHIKIARTPYIVNKRDIQLLVSLFVTLTPRFPQVASMICHVHY